MTKREIRSKFEENKIKLEILFEIKKELQVALSVDNLGLEMTTENVDELIIDFALNLIKKIQALLLENTELANKLDYLDSLRKGGAK